MIKINPSVYKHICVISDQFELLFKHNNQDYLPYFDLKTDK